MIVARPAAEARTGTAAAPVSGQESPLRRRTDSRYATLAFLFRAPAEGGSRAPGETPAAAAVVVVVVVVMAVGGARPWGAPPGREAGRSPGVQTG